MLQSDSLRKTCVYLKDDIVRESVSTCSPSLSPVRAGQSGDRELSPVATSSSDSVSPGVQVRFHCDLRLAGSWMERGGGAGWRYEGGGRG